VRPSQKSRTVTPPHSITVHATACKGAGSRVRCMGWGCSKQGAVHLGSLQRCRKEGAGHGVGVLWLWSLRQMGGKD